MHMVMYRDVLLYTYIHTNIHIHWKDHDHANERQMVLRQSGSYYQAL